MAVRGAFFVSRKEKRNSIFSFCTAEQAGKNTTAARGTGWEKPQGQSGQAGSPFLHRGTGRKMGNGSEYF